MGLAGFDQLTHRASQRKTPATIVVAGGDDPTVLQALAEATSLGWIRPILCGCEKRTHQLADELSINVDPFEIRDSDDPAGEAVAAIRAGTAELLMKGQIATPSLMKAVLRSETGLRTGKTVCQVVLMEIPRDDRRFLMSDTGITIEPTVAQLSDIVDAGVELAKSIGSDSPCVGIMAATEKVTDAMPETHLAGQLHQHRGQNDACQISGPISFDLAYSQTAGDRKSLSGEGIGCVDVMIFPNLLSANLTVKGLMYGADCRFGGVLKGLRCPVVFMSRADDTPTRLRSLVLALTQVD